jgi:hypothetical protein
MTFPRGLNQEVTHWGTTPDGYGGFTFTTPIVLNGRWEKKRMLLDRFGSGQETHSEAQVFIDTDIVEGDYLFQGTSVVADPSTLDGAFQVKKYEAVTDLRNINVTRKAWL